MSQRRVRQLQTVLRLAQMAQDRAARELAQKQRQLADARAQADQLEGYRSEYSRQRQEQGERGLDAYSLANYQRFFHNLERAADMQDERTELTAQQLEACRDQWRQRYLRRGAMERVVDQAVQEEDRVVDKAEQREQDDRPRPLD